MSRLNSKAKKLVLLKSLTENEKTRAADALAISRAPQNAWKRQKYKLFLCSLLEEGGPHLFLLCAIALGQVIVANMKERERRRLVGLARDNTQLAQPIIKDLAIQCQIPVSLESERLFNAINSVARLTYGDLTENPQHSVSDLQGQTYGEPTQAASQPMDEMHIGRRE